MRLSEASNPRQQHTEEHSLWEDTLTASIVQTVIGTKVDVPVVCRPVCLELASCGGDRVVMVTSIKPSPYRGLTLVREFELRRMAHGEASDVDATFVGMLRARLSPCLFTKS